MGYTSQEAINVFNKHDDLVKQVAASKKQLLNLQLDAVTTALDTVSMDVNQLSDVMTAIDTLRNTINR